MGNCCGSRKIPHIKKDNSKIEDKDNHKIEDENINKKEYENNSKIEDENNNKKEYDNTTIKIEDESNSSETENQRECLIKGLSPTIMSEEMIGKLSKSISRIEYDNKISTGFFMTINLQKKQYYFLLTCEHTISQDNIDSKITIKIYYGKKKKEEEREIDLDSEKRFMKSYKEFDVTLIEILPEDNIPEKKYLYPDFNYKNGYEQYINTQIYTAGYPEVDRYKGDKHFSAGQLKNINHKKQFFQHNCDTREGSSGSPLLNINQQVIGIHFGYNKSKTTNLGAFIGFIIDKLNSTEESISDRRSSIASDYFNNKS